VELSGQLQRALAGVARVPRLLVACDYDGTLAPIVARPADALPLPESVAALGALATLPVTATALISGRALRDLAQLARMPAGVVLVGSHGAEFDSGFAQPIDEELVGTIRDELAAIAAQHPGVTIEVKPASVALHVRNASPAEARAALDEARAAARYWDAQLTEGKAVAEFAVITTDKGQALDILRERQDASAVVFIGDDVTDEKVFRRLKRGDVGIKVGPGETTAQYRIADPQHVAGVLEYVLQQRRGWLSGTAPTS
jgi:trehalose 6-phosphate phosphatase